MKARVNKDMCIGCGACVATCPDVFDFNDDGYAEVKVEKVDDSNKNDVIEAKEGCPTGAVETEE